MIVANLITQFRQRMRDTAAPHLWSDAELISYINEARLELCKNAWGISDLVEATFTTLLPQTQMARNILKVKLASQAGFVVPLRSYTEVADPLTERTAATIECLLTGIKEGSLRAYPRPLNPVTVQLAVLRAPNAPITTVTDTDAVYELPEDSAQGVLYWMRASAYGKEDSETFDRGKAQEQFEMFLRFMDGYRHMHERREHQPGNVKTPTGDYW